MARTQRLFYTNSHSFAMPGAGISFRWRSMTVQRGVVGDEHARVKCLFLVHSIISISAITVHFLISLLFPVNCCYLNP